MDGVIAERNIGDGKVERFVGKFGFFKRLLADVGVGIQRLGDARRQRINFNAGDGGVAEHFLRHEADEMADAAGRFQNLSALKTKPLRRLIHGADDGR